MINYFQFKEAISLKFNNAPIENLCLIFAGKILKDTENLSSHNIKDGMTIHLVIKQGGAASAAAGSSSATTPATPAAGATPSATTTSSSTNSAPPPNVGQSPFGLGGFGGIAGMGNMGMGSANFMEMQQRMQRELVQNPDMLRQVLDNPLTQSLMSNPDVIRQMLESNPQMQEVMDRNPEIRQMLNNPEVLRQMMEIARNPSRLQEMTRTMDRQMQNLEAMPGGMNILQRMYRDVQEPVLNAMGGPNPFQDLQAANSPSQVPSTETSDPAPNPWAGGQAQPGQTAPQPPPTSGAGAQLGGQLGQGGGLFTSPGMQSLMGQMRDNPTLMSQMMSAPYMQSMFSTLASNPDQASAMLANNPLFAGNPALQQQMAAMMPQMLQQMQNPSVQQLMGNPEALQVSITYSVRSRLQLYISGNHADPAGDGETEDSGARGLPEPRAAHAAPQPGAASGRCGQLQLPRTASSRPGTGGQRSGVQPADESDDGTDEGRQPGPAPRGEVRKSAGAACQHGLRGQTGQHSG